MEANELNAAEIVIGIVLLYAITPCVLVWGIYKMVKKFQYRRENLF